MSRGIELDRRACVGSGMCVMSAPGAFELGEDRKVQLRQQVRADDEELLDAEESCPVSAIRVTLSTSEEVK